MVRNLLVLYDRSVSLAIDRLASQLALSDVNIKAVLIAVHFNTASYQLSYASCMGYSSASEKRL